MLYIERREKILEMLRKSGNVKVSDLVDIFHVDATTIRRDLKALADNEKVKMVYGGAYYINEMSQWPIEDNPDVKRTINIEKKQIVAQKAAKEIKDSDTIILNNGVTAELILDYLPEMKSLNLITQSLIIAQKAVEKQFIDVYLPGGKYRKNSSDGRNRRDCDGDRSQECFMVILQLMQLKNFVPAKYFLVFWAYPFTMESRTRQLRKFLLCRRY